MQRILIVEDDIIIGGGVKLFLESKGFICKCVNTAAEARAALAESYSLVLLDITLPDGNGLELCREIREKSRTPIIFLTANDTEEQMIEGFQQGCDDYIAKPFFRGTAVQADSRGNAAQSVGGHGRCFHIRRAER